MKICIVNACCDLGVHVDGSDHGPLRLANREKLADCIYMIKKKEKEKEKEKDVENKAKNLKYLNEFNERLYHEIESIDDFVITVGGDHSIAIASALASKKKQDDIGLIWIDSHADFHTFASTISGNIHGMPFATITGQNGNLLSYFFDGEYFNPKKSVLVGGRDIELPEYENLKNAGVKVFTTEDIKRYGAEKIMKEAIRIATENTNGMHVSYDIDIIDPDIAPGVSIKAKNGISFEEAQTILQQLILQKEKIKSFDLVEFNPDLDLEDKTYHIASYLLEEMVKNKKRQ